MNVSPHFSWIFIIGLLALLPGGGAAELLSATIRIQPIQVCSDDDTVCANPNRLLFEFETRKIWAQAGMDIEFLPWRKFYGTPWLHLGTSLFGDTYSIFTLANTPGHGQHPDPRVINLWFVRSIGGGVVYGHSWQTVPGVVERNGLAVADNVFAAVGGVDRLDVIAHELGHNLGLSHTNFGAGGATNAMSGGRLVPEGITDIFPDGARLDQLNAAQITQARSTSFVFERAILRPSKQSTHVGATVLFSLASAGAPTLRYRWWFNETNLLAQGSNFSLTLTNVQIANGGAYQVTLSNASSVLTSTVARLVIDSDRDGLPDDWELAHNFDPHDALDALLDLDGDGANSLGEFLAGTDPDDPFSTFRLEALEPPSPTRSEAVITFQGVKGRAYALESRDFPDTTWQILTSTPPATVDQPFLLKDSSARARWKRFYRLLLLPEP